MARFEEQDCINEAENMHPSCSSCGFCCQITHIAMTDEEVKLIHAYVEDNGIEPDHRPDGGCPFRDADETCMIYPVRSQTCKLYNCKVPRFRLLKEHPELKIPEKHVVDLNREFR